jgi:Tol biopolymer transport system component
MPIGPGSRLGPYEVTALIGEGGMGKVWRAHHTGLKRDDALKVLPDAFAADPERLPRFQREAQVLASLNHPNIAHVYGLEQADGVQALVMELVEGPTLADRIARGPIPVDEALPIAKQIAEALEAAHEQGIIHRDLKPANIKVRPDGTVKVLDFGLAKAMEPSGAMSPNASMSPTITSPALMTGVGMLLGTAAYMSPEQARGKVVDKRTDIWAFGCVFYEMVTGKRAFDGEDVTDMLAAVVRSEPQWNALPDSISPTLRTFLRRCLHKDSKQRVGDIRDVRLTLEGAFDVPPALRPTSASPPLRRPALQVAAAFVVGGFLAGVAAWSVWPTVASPSVTRFVYALQGQQFRNPGRPVLAVSPDGRDFVYNATGGLYLHSMNALDARLIPGTEVSTTSPFFSPDGESVGYFENGQLKRISISGGAAVVICPASNPFGVSWERDNTILFGQPQGIMRVSADGGTPELVIPAKEGEYVDSPRLLPDGESVLFSVTTSSSETRWDEAHVVVQSLSTGNRKTLLRGGSDARYVPTGHLVYALGDALFAVAFDLDRLEVSGGPVSVVQDRVVRAGNPTTQTASANYAISEGGTLLHVDRGSALGFFAAAPMRTLAWVDRQGREESLTAPLRGYVYPRLSPDGMRVALDIREPGQDIWIWDLRRETMTPMTFDPALDGLPVWTPDGRRLIWGSQRGGATINLYWQAADGTGTVERLTDSPDTHRPSSVTPDGTRLVFSEIAQQGQSAGRANLAMLWLQGDKRVTQLVQTMFAERNGEISPDGRWLAYESDESGQFQVYARPFPGVDGGRWQMSTDGGRQPLWTRNGRELIYVAPDGSLMGVAVDNRANESLATGKPARLVGGAGYYYAWNDQNQGRTYDVSPEGTRFLRLKEDVSGDNRPPRIIVVQNWFEELKRLVPTN